MLTGFEGKQKGWALGLRPPDDVDAVAVVVVAAELAVTDLVLASSSSFASAEEAEKVPDTGLDLLPRPKTAAPTEALFFSLSSSSVDAVREEDVVWLVVALSKEFLSEPTLPFDSCDESSDDAAEEMEPE